MLEKIYTIPVNEAFDLCLEYPAEGCPFCRLYRKLESDEIDIILGASMMEPAIRIKTNELGFCGRHFDMMLEKNNRLGLALILESHLNEIREFCEPGGFLGARTNAMPDKLDKLEKSCYVCERINANFSKMVENAVYLYDTEQEFRDKVKQTPYFCLPHYKGYVLSAREHMNKKKVPDFQKALADTVNRYFDELRGDVSHFCKKFDYRYENEPWGNSKDSVERAVKFLSSDRRLKLEKPKKGEQ
jgi:hypothetical protein